METEQERRIREQRRLRRKRAKRKKAMIAKIKRTVVLFVVTVLVLVGVVSIAKRLIRSNEQMEDEPIIPTLFERKIEPIEGASQVFPDLNIQEDMITPNMYSRPGDELKPVKYLIVHYTGNPQTTAQNNRDYFESLATTQDAYASSHFVVGMQGEIIQCIPLTEKCYASNERNCDSIAIECCHPDISGEFTTATYNATVKLVAQLANYYHIDMDHIIRHYDVTGKECPKYYVDNPKEWEQFKEYVEKERKKKNE